MVGGMFNLHLRFSQDFKILQREELQLGSSLSCIDMLLEIYILSSKVCSEYPN